ncbi:MAG: hypothetical protein ACYDC5_04300 [Candidatus Dormibacteria bacterium]
MASTPAPKGKSTRWDSAWLAVLYRASAELSKHRWRLLFWGLVATLGLALAGVSYWLQTYFTTRYEAGAVLGGWENFLRQGAPWPALAPAVLAGGLALMGWRRLLNVSPEPTIGLPSLERVSTSRLRSTLRRERRVVLMVMDLLVAVVLLAVARVPVYTVAAVSGSQVARATLPGVLLEGAGWLLCGGCFLLWKRRYLFTLESWGVKGDG